MEKSSLSSAWKAHQNVELMQPIHRKFFVVSFRHGNLMRDLPAKLCFSYLIPRIASFLSFDSGQPPSAISACRLSKESVSRCTAWRILDDVGEVDRGTVAVPFVRVQCVAGMKVIVEACTHKIKFRRLNF